ncbi:unnamed protein product [Dovyalis caffra]|uniref:Pentatricopeptide repeat-containing protein n=1 Tax=Dovyalis caffra TaxID=77055 RepID=A0AAV1SH85_9ROSI|nr:unnamed protein product [Dovyalis caffra]
MNLLLRSNPKPWLQQHQQGHYLLSKVLGALSFSTNTQPKDSLNLRISRAGNPKVSVIPVIEQWLEEGNDIKKSHLQNLIKQLRRYRRFSHALQISQWMGDKRDYEQSPGDFAVRLDLISKVHGLEQAEEYYNSIPDHLRGSQVYGALLNCYAHKRHLEQAEATMQKMRELGLVRTLACNVMLSLYSQLGKYEKLEALVKEMEEKGFYADVYTFNIRLHAYAVTSNIEEMEKLLMKMETDYLINVDCHTYFAAANGYLKAGLIEKSLAVLNRAEQLIASMGGNSKRHAYEVLLSLYSAAGNKDGVYHVWRLCKNMGRIFNSTYICMITSLMKLDDIDGAVWISEEWISSSKLNDIRVPNTMIRAYSRKGLWEKAEAYVNKIVESGIELEASSWDHLAMGYHFAGQMTKAVETLKKAISISKPGWKPNPYTLKACLEYLEGEGNAEAAEELSKMVSEHCPV